METSNVFVAYLLMTIVYQYPALPTKPETDFENQIFALNRKQNSLNVETKLDDDKQKIVHSTYHGEKKVEMESDEDDTSIESLKKHFLNLLGLQHEPVGTVSPARIPAFMRAVYTLYDSESINDVLYHHANPKGTTEEEDRTIRALMPQKGKLSLGINRDLVLNC